MINVIGHLEHEEGHNRETTFPMPHDGSGGKSGAQGWASAFSFGKRITTIGLLNIQTKAPADLDKDGSDGPLRRAVGGSFVDGQDPAPINAKQLETLRRTMADCGVTEAAVCGQYRLDKLEDLEADLLPGVVKRCEGYKVLKAQTRGS